MRYEDPLDEKLRSALTSSQVPEEMELWNQRIMDEIRGKTYVNVKRSIRPAVLAAVMVLALAATCFAAVKLWTPKEVSQRLGYDRLAEAFESENAVKIDETVEEDGYAVTLMGLVSGKNLMGGGFDDDQIESGGTYAVVAIANADGTPMPGHGEEGYDEEICKPFFVSPLISGLKPWMYNIASMSGGYVEEIIDGVRYRLISCDNVEIFADHKMYLCVSDGPFFDRTAFGYDESTGEIFQQESYDGLNVLFDLPLDEEKADPERAEAYVKGLWPEE